MVAAHDGRLRVCLRCDRKFHSSWLGNRICPLCQPLLSHIREVRFVLSLPRGVTHI
jgi:hypothetical protein